MYVMCVLWPLLLLVASVAAPAFAEQLSVKVAAESALLINADTGVILFEKNSRKRQFPASTTKIASVAYALKLKGDDLKVKIAADQDAIAFMSQQQKKRLNYSQSAWWLEDGASHMGIKKG